MALSEWDLLAINEKGEPTQGVFTTPLGIEAEIYKNWIYIGDKAGWKKGGNYVKPTVMQIQHGVITYKDLHLLVLRGPQNGVYVVAWSYKDGDYSKPLAMLGCGVRGYTEDKKFRTRYVGVMKSSLAWFKKELRRKKVSRYTTTTYIGNAKPIHKRRTMLEDVHDIPDEVRKINFGLALRFNQGDRYFVTNGVPSAGAVATPVGKQKKETLFSELTKGMFPKQKKKKKTSTQTVSVGETNEGK